MISGRDSDGRRQAVAGRALCSVCLPGFWSLYEIVCACIRLGDDGHIVDKTHLTALAGESSAPCISLLLR